ncbi:DUF1996 domain-containing protein [Paraburkholderia fungorum]|uniref:DUF1996 domain-containing protein n=1 Tax=Paraburkholderia fungorum TaxID=134537 RepID=UPI0038BAAE64
MKTHIMICIMLMLAAGAAHAGSGFAVRCTYSHTRPDDSIVHPGKPGQAMVHDFFGNTSTDAYSTYDSLSNNKLTTCDSIADVSAYWVPQLKRASGIVMPQYQKTYYKNDQPVVALQAIQPGFEMLAGNHMGTAPNSHINFLCRGGSYTTVAPTNCPVVTDSSGTYSQLDISVHFPDCWDGKTLVPNFADGTDNMTYRNADGTCPSAYPVKIPELQLNVAYNLGQDPDLATAQLSMDPMMMNGQWVPQWGGMYTAHGDFVNAWKTDVMQYVIDKCMNTPTSATCGSSLPTYYSAASADVWLDSSGAVHPADTTLVSAPGSVVLIKFATPLNLGDYPYAKSYLQTQGQNMTDSNAIMLQLYAATTTWDDATQLPTASACTTQQIGGIYLDNASQVRLNDVTSYIASQAAAGASQIGICIRNANAETVQFSSREGSWGPGLYLK